LNKLQNHYSLTSVRLALIVRGLLMIKNSDCENALKDI